MIELTHFQKLVLDLVKNSDRKNPITGARLTYLVGVKEEEGKTGANMRSIIHALRTKGYPICANDKGYWWPNDRQELQDYIESLEGRIMSQTKALSALRGGFDQIE